MPPALLRRALVSACLAAAPAAVWAQAPATNRILGTVTTIAGASVTVHGETQAGAAATDETVTVSPQTRLLRTTPGETTLKNASPLALSDLAVGDRVLVRMGADGAASLLVAIKQADISDAHAAEAADWQRRGVTGIVQQVDAAAGVIALRPEAGKPAVLVHTTPQTQYREYAADSTAFADTHKASLAGIHAGDQLRARGDKGADGAEVAAVEVVTGSFRNIAGTVVSQDPGANTLTLMDLANKKPVTLHLEPHTQLRKLPPEVALRLARRGQRPAGAGESGQPGGTSRGAGGGAAVSSETSSSQGSGGEGSRPHALEGQGGRGGDVAALLQRAPAILAADLKPGEAVMVVASGLGAKQSTAITVIAGVGPLLQGSADASAGVFSASWNLNGGEAAGGEAAQ